ncbi:hypothetical protein LNAOJCKE_5622 [Methylorubrum aminovorans]|uniref:Uncharacterized protein n=1 Tax=Methylorubrum aminovorans TaxID=269069 RepID=A0ABQ4UM14_9HYPH|nr:hypothetical protein LNAOJCKE_5622 [Methylorubrum aminovorans]
MRTGGAASHGTLADCPPNPRGQGACGEGPGRLQDTLNVDPAACKPLPPVCAVSDIAIFAMGRVLSKSSGNRCRFSSEMPRLDTVTFGRSIHCAGAAASGALPKATLRFHPLPSSEREGAGCRILRRPAPRCRADRTRPVCLPLRRHPWQDRPRLRGHRKGQDPCSCPSGQAPTPSSGTRRRRSGTPRGRRGRLRCRGTWRIRSRRRCRCRPPPGPWRGCGAS